MLNLITMSQFEETPAANLHDVFEAAGIGWFQLDMDGRYAYINPALAIIYGCTSPREMLNWLEETKQSDVAEQERIAELLKLLQSQKMVKEFELQTCSRNGKPIWMLLTVKVLWNERNIQLGYEGIAIDISRRKRAEAERMQLLACEQAARLKSECLERRFRELIDGLIDAIVWECAPETLQFTFVSRSAERILGYPIEQWQTKPEFWVNILHPEDRDWVVAFCQQET
jgi:PAS domain S-box-containing protein